MATIGVDGSSTTGYKVIAKAFDAVSILDSVHAISAQASGEVAQRLSEVIYRSGLADALKGASATKYAVINTDVWHHAR